MAQWANFLRNHDEIDLGRLTAASARRSSRHSAPTPEMQLYDRGHSPAAGARCSATIDRVLDGVQPMFTLPGTPVIRYGDEIGMGENLELEGT